jgi:hypothetical protein
MNLFLYTSRNKKEYTIFDLEIILIKLMITGILFRLHSYEFY